MPKKKTVNKNPAAVALGKRRWDGVSAADKSAAMSELAKKSAASMTPEQRKARAMKAVQAREANRKKKSSKKS